MRRQDHLATKFINVDNIRVSRSKSKAILFTEFSNFIRMIVPNIRRVFTGWNLLAHATLIALTVGIVLSGLDWWWFVHSRWVPDWVYWPAAVIGALLPILVPVILLFVGAIRRNRPVLRLGFMLGQAAILGSLISSFYKSLTGRMPPILNDTLHDISHQFNFGFWEHGIFWGWPSSHTTIAFAMAISLITCYPHNKVVRIAGLVYAFYIGLSVSISIHWLSEFVAGAILGAVIGMVVGKVSKKA